LFYRMHGPFWRARLAERLGSTRYSKPALYDVEDRLAPFLPERPGVFLEAGAHDGFTQSNTYWLERHAGWSGVLVEPIPALAARCRRTRPRAQVFSCALVGEASAGDTVTITYGDLMSTLVGGPGSVQDARTHATQGAKTAGQRNFEIEVPARTLTSVLEEAGVDGLDLAVLDVEGHELDVLEGLDMERFAPTLLMVEMLDLPRLRPRIEAELSQRYEPVEEITAYDMLYRLRV
jgi:FkbM family methyltransferase